MLIADTHDQRMADREGKWQSDRKARSLSRGRLHVKRAAELLYLGGHDVHANATAGRLRHALAVEKPGSRTSCITASSLSC